VHLQLFSELRRIYRGAIQQFNGDQPPFNHKLAYILYLI